MDELVSIVMPCYNDGMYIEESIKSVYRQTYCAIELIVVDDGSDDEKTLEVLKRLEHDSFCSLLFTDHKGPSVARNIGIAKASGKYILPLDSDDIIDPTYIEKAVDAIEKKPEYGVVYCYADTFGTINGPWNLPIYSFEQMLRDNIVFVTALFYREDWKKVGGFNENMKHGMEDYDFWISILEIGREIYQIPEVLFHYRIKEQSRSTLLEENIDNIKKMYRLIYENHPTFYTRYRDEYALALRNALIEQVCSKRVEGGRSGNQGSNKYADYYNELRSKPILRHFIKKI